MTVNTMHMSMERWLFQMNSTKHPRLPGEVWKHCVEWNMFTVHRTTVVRHDLSVSPASLSVSCRAGNIHVKTWQRTENGHSLSSFNLLTERIYHRLTSISAIFVCIYRGVQCYHDSPVGSCGRRSQTQMFMERARCRPHLRTSYHMTTILLW